MIYLYILLLRVVAYLEGPEKIVSFAVVILMMCYSTLKRVSLKPPLKASKIKVYSFFALILIIVHSLLLSKISLANFAILFTYWFWLVFMLSYFKDKTIDEGLNFILISFLIYNIANYLFYLSFFSEQKIGINSIMGMFGILRYRIYFPLSSGANIFTSQLALNALIAVHLIKVNSGNRKRLYIIIYAFLIYMLIIADSRLILIFAIVFSYMYWFSWKKTLYFLKSYWYIIILILITFLYIFYSTNIFDWFKRAGERTEKTLSRIEIWTLAFEVIFNDLGILIGNGINGFKNNMPEETLIKFESQVLTTSHNFIIQSIIDYGLLGLMFIFTIIFRLLKMINILKYRIITILFIVILLMGTTESIPTFYSFEPTLFFIALSALIIRNYERKVN